MSVIPFVAEAYAAVDPQQFGNVLNPILTNIVNPIIGLMFAIAVVVFAFGVFQVVWNKTDAEAYARGKMSMLGGVIGMFIMVSAWGIIYVISNTIKGI